jgi:hypothetical protein
MVASPKKYARRGFGGTSCTASFCGKSAEASEVLLVG